MKVYFTERTTVQLNIFYLHAWLLQHRIASLSLTHSDQLQQSLYLIIRRNNVLLYGSEWNQNVHDELCRQQRVLFRSLDDLFSWSNLLDRCLGDIIFSEVLNEQVIDSHSPDLSVSVPEPQIIKNLE